MDVLQRANETRSISDTLWHRTHSWLGHVQKHNGFLKDILEVQMIGKRTYGFCWKKYAELERRAEDRKWWQELKSWNQKSYTGFSADYWTMMMNWGKILIKAESWTM